MTYTFKLARRLAILRHFVVLIILALLVACEKDLTAPQGGSTGSPESPFPIRVLPRSVTIETSQRVQFRAVAHGMNFRDFTLPVTWTTTGGSISPNGTFSSSSVGTFKVIGRGRGRKHQDTSVVIVVPPPSDLVRIEITPGSATLDTGATRSFTATGYLSDGTTAAVGVVWSATGGEIDPSGVYTAGSATGSYRVLATTTSGALADTSAITITKPTATLVNLILSPTSASLSAGASKQFKVYGRDSDGDSVAVAASFTATGGAISSTGLFTAGQTSGTYRVIASANGLADTAAVSIAGSNRALAAGFWNYPLDSYCNTMGVTSASRPFATSNLLDYLQQARKCNVRLVLIPARRFITTTGENRSPFSLDSAKAFTDRMAKILTPDTLRKYDPYIIGFNLGDDYGCAECWGGVKVTQSEIAAWASYLRQKIPGLRIGVRVEPAWVQNSSTLANLIDYAWAQYHTGKGDAKTYFDKQSSIAKQLGIALAMGVNVEDCGGNNTAACTPSQLKTFMGMAAQYPGNCALLGWTYSSTTMGQPGMKEAWDYVLDLAAQHPDLQCKQP